MQEADGGVMEGIKMRRDSNGGKPTAQDSQVEQEETDEVVCMFPPNSKSCSHNIIVSDGH